MNEKELGPITIREKVVIILVIFVIRMLKPWSYDHQFTQFWEEIKLALTEEFKVKGKEIK